MCFKSGGNQNPTQEENGDSPGVKCVYINPCL